LKACIHNQSRKRPHDSSETEEEPSKRPSLDIPQQSSQALDNALINYDLDLKKHEQGGDDIFKTLTRGLAALKPTILQNLEQKKSIKIHVSLELLFHLSTDTDFITDPAVVLNTEPLSILQSTDIQLVLKEIFDSLIAKIEDFSLRGSGWVLNRLLNIQLHVTEFQPLRASTTFELPKEIRDKKAVINIQNTCNRCFLYCVSAALP
jgi:hypothetical protein